MDSAEEELDWDVNLRMASAFLLCFPYSFSLFMMYDRRKGVYGRYGNVPILSSGFLY